MKVIDISGLGHSGKTAVTDLLREIDGIHAHHNSFEFNLLRLPDGILDLQHALCESWSPSRSDLAIKRFQELCRSHGHYSDLINKKYDLYVSEFIKSLIEATLYVDGWYDPIYNYKKYIPPKSRLQKLKDLVNPKQKKQELASRKSEVYITDSKNFSQKARQFLEKILLSELPQKTTALIMNNAFEPFLPQVSLNYFQDAYSVIVERDPRDIYASIVKVEDTFVPQFETDDGLFTEEYIEQLKEDFLGTADIKTFIKRQKVYREKMLFEKDHPRIVYVKYEDLVLKYDETVNVILTKVGINPSLHTEKKQYFDPTKSEANVGVWKKIKDSAEIKLIEHELKQDLYTC